MDSIAGTSFTILSGWATPQNLEDDLVLAHGSTLDLDFEAGVGLAAWVREEEVSEVLTRRKIFGALYR